MKYVHYCEPSGDEILKTLLKIRREYGARWTDSMASYAIGKTRGFRSLRWREKAEDGVPYTSNVFVWN